MRSRRARGVGAPRDGRVRVRDRRGAPRPASRARGNGTLLDRASLAAAGGGPSGPRSAGQWPAAAPFFTLFPAAPEDPAEPTQPQTLRFADPAWRAPPAELPDWWEGSELPLVYVTLGSVAGGLEMAAQAYRAAVDAIGDLDARVLLTVGHEADLTAFSSPPANVHVERWVPQADVLARVSAVVCHGDSGSTLGALAAGGPLVVVPLFADQPYNARAVEAARAGVAVDAAAEPIRAAVERVLTDPALREGAEAVAAEMAAHSPADEAVAALERLADYGAAP